MAKTAGTIALCVSFSHAFTPALPLSRVLQRQLPVARMSDDDQPQVVSLSSITSKEAEEAKAPAWQKYQEENAGFTQDGINPTNYEGFVDSEGFDGGDGQVGVVGDGGNAMDTFDDRSSAGSGRARVNSQGITESKKMQKNAFGQFTGYAEELEQQGMSQVDEYGEDRLAARRQQLENWRNQREIRSQQVDVRQEMSDFTGVEYDERRATQSYMNALQNAGNVNDDAKWNMYRGDAKAEALTEAADGLQKGDITEVVEMTCQFPAPAFGEIKVENDAMTYEEFKVGFSADSENGGSDWQVSPLSGELNRRGGDPQILSLVFKPSAPGGTRNAWLIVETEESKWTYHLVGNVM